MTKKIMNRKDEIKEILKHLLRETDNAIGSNGHSGHLHIVKQACNNVLELSKDIEKYIKELSEIEDVDTI